MCLGADGDNTALAAVFCLVTVPMVQPDVARPVDVTWAHSADFIRACPRKPLEAYHCGQGGRGMLNRQIDHSSVYGLYGLRLTGFGPALVQPVHRQQAVVDGCGDKLLTRRPLEHAPDPANSLVDVGPAVARFDHPLSDVFQGDGSEVRRRSPTVQGLHVT